MNSPITDSFEVWLDEQNEKEPWPPTYASWNRFCEDTGALTVSSTEALAIWTAYSVEGFSVVHEDGSIHC